MQACMACKSDPRIWVTCSPNDAAGRCTEKIRNIREARERDLPPMHALLQFDLCKVQVHDVGI